VIPIALFTYQVTLVAQRYFPWRIETMANKSLANLAFDKVTRWGGR